MDKRRVTVILYPGDEGRYVAFMPLLPGCTTQGDSPANAMEMAKESVELMLDDATEDDLEALDVSWVPHVVVGEVEVHVPKQKRKAPKPTRAQVTA